MSHRDHGSRVLSVTFAGAVIAVAVLFPVFSGRHRGSQFDSCISNEKQIGLALLQYSQDSDGQLPSGTQGAGEGWAGQVFPYIKDPHVYSCYDDAAVGTASTPVVSYGYNTNAAQTPKVAAYPAPSRTVLMFEVAHDLADVAIPDEGASQGSHTFSTAGDGTEGTLLSGQGDARYATGLLGTRPPASFSQFDQPRHEDGSNFFLADGHVRWIKPAGVSSGTDAARAVAPQTGETKGNAAGTANTAYQATFSVK